MTKRGGLRALALAALIAGSVGALPEPARAEESTGWRIGAAVATALYAPAKALYAATGLLMGGVGYGISGGNQDAMDLVADPAVKGDYILTPEHLRGERKVEFVGRDDAPVYPAPSLADGDAGAPGVDAFGYPY
jgi:hypothetical protein